MLYGEIIAVCSQIHIKHKHTYTHTHTHTHTHTLFGQNVGFVSVKLTVQIVTTGL